MALKHPSTEGILLIDASNAFNSLNRKAALNNIKYTCPEFSCYINNLYRGDAELFVANSEETVRSCEGTTVLHPTLCLSCNSPATLYMSYAIFGMIWLVALSLWPLEPPDHGSTQSYGPSQSPVSSSWQHCYPFTPWIVLPTPSWGYPPPSILMLLDADNPNPSPRSSTHQSLEEKYMYKLKLYQQRLLVQNEHRTKLTNPIKNCVCFDNDYEGLKFYVYDLGMDLEQIRNIKFYKFADDGTAKVSASTLEECLDLINLVLESICEWTRVWRMVVNCNRNKTELICFNKIQLTKDFLLLGQNKIFFTDSSKVLGVTIDKRLDFKDHSKDVYNRLLGKWVMMSKYSSRNWGMNQEVTVRILKTMFSSLFYGSMVWMKEDNTRELNGLIYKMSKSALGAVFHVSQVNTEVILGLPPFWIVNKVNSVKHYLKLIGNQPEAYKDSLILYIQEEITLKKNSTIVSQIKEVFQYLKWKLEVAPGDLSELDKDIVYRSDIDRFQDLSMEGCKYSRSIMTKYTEKLWQQSVNNRLQLEGETRYPAAP